MRNLHSASVGAALPRGMRHSDTNDPCIAVEQRELTSVAPQERGPPRCGIRGGGLAAEGNLTGMGGAGEWFVGSGRGYDVPADGGLTETPITPSHGLTRATWRDSVRGRTVVHGGEGASLADGAGTQQAPLVQAAGVKGTAGTAAAGVSGGQGGCQGG